MGSGAQARYALVRRNDGKVMVAERFVVERFLQIDHPVRRVHVEVFGGVLGIRLQCVVDYLVDTCRVGREGKTKQKHRKGDVRVVQC